MAPRKTITAKQYRTIKNIPKQLESGVKDPLRQAAIEAGYSPKSAGRKVSDIIKNPTCHELMVRALEEANIDQKLLALKTKELLEAKHPQFPSRPDNFIQHKTLETAIKMLDGFPTPRIQMDKREVIVNITADAAELINKAIELRQKYGNNVNRD